MLLCSSSPETLEQPVQLDFSLYEPAVAFLRDERPLDGFVPMTPQAIRSFVEHQIHVFMQHGFSDGTPFTDMDYARVGVIFEDDLFQLSRMVRTLVKFQPFTQNQLALMRNEQILISTQIPVQMTLPYVQLMQQKKISAIGLNFIKDQNGCSITDRILTETMSPQARNIAFSNFLLPLLMSFVCSPRLRFALQRIPKFMEGTYCFNGQICHREIADLLGIPCQDIVTLCWDLN